MATSANTFEPTYAVPTGWVLQDHIEALGISPLEFAHRCECPPELISDIISGFGVIDSIAATAFGRETGLNKDLWLRMEVAFRRKLAEFYENSDLAQWAQEFPAKELVKRGAVSQHSLGAENMARMMSFYNFWSPEEGKSRYGPDVVSYGNSPDFDNNRQAIAAWLRLGEIQAQRTECPKYGEVKFRKSLSSVRELTGSQQGLSGLLEEAQGLLLNSGVVLLSIDPLSGATAGSAAWWLPEDKFMGIPAKPVIQLNARHKTDASLWYGLFHAATHILLHGKRRVFVDPIPNQAIKGEANGGDAEDQADAWAQDFLVPRSNWNAFTDTFLGSAKEVRHFAAEQGIAPGIIVGRLQHEGLLDWNRLNTLKHKLVWTET